jgi:polysaccharide export outer membrane protein
MNNSSPKFSLSFFGLVLISFLFVSCGSKKDIVYFQNIENLNLSEQVDSAHYEYKITNNDNLLITVSSLNPVTVEPFNVVNLSRANLTTNSMEFQGYLVDEIGEINFPVVGKLKVGGLSKAEAETLIQNAVSYYLEDKVTVNIRVINYRISILGEVNRPGSYPIYDEKITIPQALALAGDLTIYGQRHDVQIYRVENGQKQFYTIDLTRPDVFLSPVFYLQQNDVIYVKPNGTKAASSTYNQNLPLFMSLISVTITAIALFVRK